MADDLVQENGIDHAVKIVIENVSNAKSADDNYELSIWRDVRSLLRKLEAWSLAQFGLPYHPKQNKNGQLAYRCW